MIRKLMAATALALVAVAPANAAQFSVQLGTVAPGTTGDNYFANALSGLGLTQFAAPVTSISLTGPATIEFFYLGSESGYNNRFTAGSVTYTDGNPAPAPAPYNEIEDYMNGAGNISALLAAMSSNLNTPNGVYMGGYFANTGAITNWTFDNVNNDPLGVSASIGDVGFGIFLPSSAASNGVFTSDWLLIGYDDQDGSAGDDDNHDDFMLLARISAVPESGTWAMLLAGFMTLGAALRRRPTSVRARQAV